AASVLVKPLAAPMIPILLMLDDKRARLTALGAAAGIALALALCLPELREMGHVAGIPTAHANISLVHLLALFGARPPAWLLAALVTAAACAFLRWRAPADGEVESVA